MKSKVEDDKSPASSPGTFTDSSSYCSSRASRNLAEKQRRDNLNTNISMMAALVPNIASSSKRHDKISILRLAAAYLRSNFTIGPGVRHFIPPEYSDIDLEENFVDGFDGTGSFLLVVTITGNIVYISPRVEGPLGYSPVEMMGKSIYSYVHPEDHAELSKALTPDEYVQPVKKIAYYNEDCSTNEETTTTTTTTSNVTAISTITNNNNDKNNINHNNNCNFKEQRRSFYVKIAQRTNSRGEHTQFKCFHVTGVLRLADFLRKKNNSESAAVGATNNDIIFTGIAKVIHKRITELSLYEANKQEYITRHLVDGRIVFSDHRIALVAGYMSEEVSGVNAFRFMHKDDVMWAITALRQMYDRREGFGTSCYRLLSKSGKFIYLRTHGWLEFDNKTGTFESFICVNTLVEKDEGENLIKELRNRFSATVTQISATSAGSSLPSTSPSSTSSLSSSSFSSSSSTSSSVSHYSPSSPPKFGISPDLSVSAAVTTAIAAAVVPTSTTTSPSLSTVTSSTPASVGTIKKLPNTSILPQTPSQSEQNVEDPTQLEDAIYQLISTLKSPSTAPSLSPSTSDIECNPENTDTTTVTTTLVTSLTVSSVKTTTTTPTMSNTNLFKLSSSDKIPKADNRFEDESTHKNKRIKTELSNSFNSSSNPLNGYDANCQQTMTCYNSKKLLNNSEKKLNDNNLIINDEMLSLNSPNLLFSGNEINSRLMRDKKNNDDNDDDDDDDGGNYQHDLKQSNNIYLKKYDNDNVNKNEQETACVKMELNNGIGVKRPGEIDKRKDKRRHISIRSTDQVNNLIVVKNNEIIVNKLQVQAKKGNSDEVIDVNKSNNLIIDKQVNNDKNIKETLFNIDNHINGQSKQFGRVELIYNEKDCETIKQYHQLKTECQIQNNIIKNFKDDHQEIKVEVDDYTI